MTGRAVLRGIFWSVMAIGGLAAFAVFAAAGWALFTIAANLAVTGQLP